MSSIKNHQPADFFIKKGIKKPTFFQRVTLREIKYIQIPNGQRIYDVKDWNEKCPDDQMSVDN